MSGCLGAEEPGDVCRALAELDTSNVRMKAALGGLHERLAVVLRRQQTQAAEQAPPAPPSPAYGCDLAQGIQERAQELDRSTLVLTDLITRIAL